MTAGTKSTEKIVHLAGFGPVIMRRSPRARRLTIRIKQDGTVTLTIPLRFSSAAALAFLDSQRSWIIAKSAHLEAMRSKPLPYDGNFPLQTRRHHLELQAAAVSGPKVRILQDKIKIDYPAYLKITAPEVQAAIAQGLTAAYRREAQEYLPERVRQLALRYGFQYQKVRIKNQKSCWGSCSKRNNINLNLHLMRLPDELIDYVILHELTHTRVHDHSSRFWLELERILPQARQYRRQLQRYARAGFLSSLFIRLDHTR